ncbi:MAG TPA: prepilin-type N-terminal cleavage/methylation domain-containing protein [Myxococcota bacterium]|nr:prepilin-type N-terminal cleavage/methylation domain-containing protein [Myxococcota bacterium]
MKHTVTRKLSRDESGYTLIEVMIAMAILGIGLMSIAVAQLTAIRMTARSKNMQQAMFLAREAMDDLDARQQPGDLFLSTNATTPDAKNPIQVGNDQEDGTRFNRQITVTPGDPEAGMARVVVQVTWLNAATSATNVVQLTATKRIP